MKRKAFLTLALCLIVAVTGCSKNTGKTSSNKEDISIIDNEEGVTFTDSLGRELTVTKAERVVTLLGSFCDEWMAAGGSVVGTASDTFTSYDFDFDENVANTGSNLKPDVETIINLEPDLVIASSKLDGQVEIKETLENAGITVAYFNVDNFEDYSKTMEIFTKITGRSDLYNQNVTEVKETIDEAKNQVDGRKPKVLLIRAAASSVKVKTSTGTVAGEILKDLDTVNIADSNSSLEDLSMEAIILEDPDYIFVTVQGSDVDAALENVNELLISNPAWSTLTAVKNNNYYVLDKMLYNAKPNARWGEAYQGLADIIYPND
ncbi:MAG: ABC transporter substrate-binding protein [Lachnospira sp.]|nr:ABC transporter substrate-binding protein [Lachnospira sp.]